MPSKTLVAVCDHYEPKSVFLVRLKKIPTYLLHSKIKKGCFYSVDIFKGTAEYFSYRGQCKSCHNPEILDLARRAWLEDFVYQGDDSWNKVYLGEKVSAQKVVQALLRRYADPGDTNPVVQKVKETAQLLKMIEKCGVKVPAEVVTALNKSMSSAAANQARALVQARIDRHTRGLEKARGDLVRLDEELSQRKS